MSIVSAILGVAPLLLVFIVGGVLAAMRMELHPTAARLSLAGLALLAVCLLTGRAATALITTVGLEAFPMDQISLLLGVVGGIVSLGNMIGVGALIAAAWVGREEAL